MNDPFDDTLEEAIRSNCLLDNMRVAAEEYPAVRFAPRAYGDPWEEGFGMFRDAPYFERWQEAVRQYRRERDAGEDETEALAAAA
jgi:hypothetical protein